eukprot:5296413-Amphidinium_carterae.2
MALRRNMLESSGRVFLAMMITDNATLLLRPYRKTPSQDTLIDMQCKFQTHTCRRQKDIIHGANIRGVLQKRVSNISLSSAPSSGWQSLQGLRRQDAPPKAIPS